MRLMDLWLAIHSPAPYEFFLDGSDPVGQVAPGPSESGFNGAAAAYVTIFGLEFDGVSSNHRTSESGAFDLRVFGFHNQATNITLQAGLRSQSADGADAHRNALGGVSMTIYLA